MVYQGYTAPPTLLFHSYMRERRWIYVFTKGRSASSTSQPQSKFELVLLSRFSALITLTPPACDIKQDKHLNYKSKSLGIIEILTMNTFSFLPTSVKKPPGNSDGLKSSIRFSARKCIICLV